MQQAFSLIKCTLMQLIACVWSPHGHAAILRSHDHQATSSILLISVAATNFDTGSNISQFYYKFLKLILWIVSNTTFIVDSSVALHQDVRSG